MGSRQGGREEADDDDDGRTFDLRCTSSFIRPSINLDTPRALSDLSNTPTRPRSSQREVQLENLSERKGLVRLGGGSKEAKREGEGGGGGGRATDNVLILYHVRLSRQLVSGQVRIVTRIDKVVFEKVGLVEVGRKDVRVGEEGGEGRVLACEEGCEGVVWRQVCERGREGHFLPELMGGIVFVLQVGWGLGGSGRDGQRS